MQISFRRNIEVKTSFGNDCSVTDLGQEGRVFDCEGVFYGASCYPSCKNLAQIFTAGENVTLTHSQWGEVTVLMTQLDISEECRENFLRYRMRLVEVP